MSCRLGQEQVKSLQRILVLTPWFPERAGGRYLYILDQIEALAAEGIGVDVVVVHRRFPSWLRRLRSGRLAGDEPDRNLAIDFRMKVIRSVGLPGRLLPVLREPLTLLNVRAALKARLNETPYALIHAHTEACGYAATRIAAACKIPSVITLHGIPQERYLQNRISRAQFRETLTLASRVILVGQPLVEPFQRIASDAKFEVILNGYSLPAGLRPSERLPRQRSMRIVSVSNLVSSKGVDITLRALDELARSGITSFEYVVVGEGPEKNNLQALAHKLGLTDRTFFTGLLPHREAMEEVLAADVFCLPSWREACGIAYLEAMALGKIAIGCRTQGPAQFIHHGGTGLLVEPRSVRSLAEILANLVRQPLLYESIGSAAAHFARTHFSWNANANKVIALYREISPALNKIVGTTV